MKDKFYLIDGKIVGKRNNNGDFLYKKGKWILDTCHVIGDCLIGYDSSEDKDSPYAIGNTEIMDRIEDISAEKAFMYMDSDFSAYSTFDITHNPDRNNEKGFAGLKDGSACLLVIDPDGNKMWESELVKWLQSNGFTTWGIKGHYGCKWIYINLNTKVFAPGMPGISLSKVVCNHAITKEEFFMVYNLFLKYNGKNPLEM